MKPVEQNEYHSSVLRHYYLCPPNLVFRLHARYLQGISEDAVFGNIRNYIYETLNCNIVISEANICYDIFARGIFFNSLQSINVNVNDYFVHFAE